MRLIGRGREDGATDSILSTVSFQQKHGFSIKKSLDSSIRLMVARMRVMPRKRVGLGTANAAGEF
jgi:hypothetical protein